MLAHASCAARPNSAGGLCLFYFPTEIGVAGVDVFFVLSGFIISFTGPLAARRPTGGQFFWRRWSRVAPIYYLLSVPWIAQAAMNGRLNWPQSVDTFLFWPAAGPSLVTPYLLAGWTLSFEMIFYTAMSAVLAGSRFRRNLMILGLAIAATAAARLVTAWNPVRVLASPFFIEFATGSALACLWPRLKAAPVALGLGLVASGAGIFVGEAVWGASHSALILAGLSDIHVIWRVALFGPPAGLLVAGACILERVVAGRLAAILAWLGDASYSIYLSHSMSVPAFTYIWFATIGVASPWLTAPAVIIASLGVGAACFVFVERPLLRDLRRVRFGAAVAAAPVSGSQSGRR